MTTRTPAAASAALHSAAGKSLGVEATTLSAGDTVVFQNTGNTVVHVNIPTTAGTGTVVALVSANNVAITLAVGNNLFGPYDPAIFGNSVTITTATAVGTVGLYQLVPRIANNVHNPFESVSSALDA